MKTKSFLMLGRRMFAKAVELDPLYARAYAGMADCDSALSSRHGVKISLDDILAITAKALTLDPNLPEAHAARGAALSMGGQAARAAAEFEQALALGPNCYEAHYSYARFCLTSGHFEQAAKHFIRAWKSSQTTARSPTHLAGVFNSLGRHDEAEKYAQQD